MSQPTNAKPTRSQRIGLAVTGVIVVPVLAGAAWLLLDPPADPRLTQQQQGTPTNPLSVRPSPATPGGTGKESSGATSQSGSQVRQNLERALATRVFFAHQSIGENILNGLPAALASEGLPAPRVVSPDDGSSTEGGVFMHALIGTNGDPLGKIADFQTYVSQVSKAGIDIAILKLCYVDFETSTDVKKVFAAYSSAMERLEAQYPDITFIYTTTPLTAKGSPANAVNANNVHGLADASQSGMPIEAVREKYNALVRDRYRDTGRLFDIAALEASVDDGKVMAQEYKGDLHYAMNPELADTDREHLNSTGSKRLGKKLLELIGHVLAE